MNPLVIIPTYNERGNVGPILEQLNALRLGLDYLFIDDHSPDGTGEALDALQKENPTLHLLHRKGKEGIGSAHLAGLDWARQRGYAEVITMDCDLTHCPTDIPAFLEAAKSADVVVGSRYMRRASLAGWNWRRKFLTRLAHFLTRTLLGTRYDSTGAYRLYRLDRLPEQVFKLIRSPGYPFFFESLFVLEANGASIKETPINLPPRTYGSSKMPAIEPFRGIRHLLRMALDRLVRPEVFRLPSHPIQANPLIAEDEGWTNYWNQADDSSGSVLYQTIASIYRRLVITRRLTQVIRKTFPAGSRLLHAGCGSGHVDARLQETMRLTAIDTSLKALAIYSRTVPRAEEVRHASIFALPFPDASFDGTYHLGVIEHFSEKEIVRLLGELRRILKPTGRMVIFWPHSRATSVAVLRLWHSARQKWAPHEAPLHPAEPSLLKTRAWAEELLGQAGFRMDNYEFDGRDFWVQAVITASPNPAPPSH